MEFTSFVAALIASLLVMLVSLAGVVFSVGTLGRWMHRYITYLATFSGGVFLLVAYHLASEAVHEGGWILAVTSVLLGASLMEAVHFLIPTKHHHHDIRHDHSHTAIEGRSVLFSDGLHNIGDGIFLVGAFAADWYIGIAASVGVVLHETVQEISEYFVLREAGYSNVGALKRNFAVSSTILIGFILAATLSSVEWVLALLSGIAAGGFLSVILHDLLPHAIASVRAHGGAYVHATALIVGSSLMFGIQTILPDEQMDSSRMSQQATGEIEERTEPTIRPSAPTKPLPKVSPSVSAPETESPVSQPATASDTKSTAVGSVPVNESPTSQLATTSTAESIDPGSVRGVR